VCTPESQLAGGQIRCTIDAKREREREREGEKKREEKVKDE
jgi:hypothetical protein